MEEAQAILEQQQKHLTLVKKHLPDKKWLVAVISTIRPGDEIFEKDYLPPTKSKERKEFKTI